jgi:hypothetical protein
VSTHYHHKSSDRLLRDLAAFESRQRANLADLLACLAEFDARKLYVQDGYPSMEAYCWGELHFDEEGIPERILAARTARRFPTIFDALADGRLNIAAVALLAPHLTEEGGDELLAAAEHKPESEIKELLAARFPEV